MRYILAAHDTSDLCVCVILAQGAMLTHHSNHNRHVQQMCSLLGLNKRLQSKKTPGHTDMTQQDTTGELSPALAKTFRTCVGLTVPCLRPSTLPACCEYTLQLTALSRPRRA